MAQEGDSYSDYSAKGAKFLLKTFSYEKFAIMLIWSGMIVLFVTFILFYFSETFTKIFTPQTITVVDKVGEYTGSVVNALWALAAVVLYYEALRFQRMELKLQRHELELNRQEVIEQTHQIRTQNETLAVQAFENTIFQLLMLHNDIVNSMIMTARMRKANNPVAVEVEIRGRECFVEYYNIIKRTVHSSFDDVQADDFSPNTIAMLLDYSYRIFYNEYQANLGHYFRNIYTILNLINNSKSKNSKFYVDLLHSQLSNNELLLLYFHCLSDIGKSFKPLIEKFSLFYDMPEDELIALTKELFSKTAFSKP